MLFLQDRNIPKVISDASTVTQEDFGGQLTLLLWKFHRYWNCSKVDCKISKRKKLTFLIEFRVCHSSKYWLMTQKRKIVPFPLLIWWILSKTSLSTLHKLTHRPGPLIFWMRLNETAIPHMVTWSFWKTWMKWMRHDIAASKFADEPRIANKIPTLLF